MSSAAGLPAELTGKQILVVDDNAIDRRILDLQTEEWGLGCRTFPSAADALAGIDDGDHYDLAIIGMHMPDVDGIELAHELRVRRPDLPLVLSTSLGTEASDPVFAGELPKPAKQSQLFDLLVSILVPVDGSATRATPVGADDGPPMCSLYLRRSAADWAMHSGERMRCDAVGTDLDDGGTVRSQVHVNHVGIAAPQPPLEERCRHRQGGRTDGICEWWVHEPAHRRPTPCRNRSEA